MEENDSAITSNDPAACINCKLEKALDGYPTRLCSTCRESFIKYPIPKWIYGFGLGVLVVMIFSMAQLPKYVGVAGAFGRAEKAIESRNYVTAQRNLEKVLQKLPSFKLAQAYMLIASCYNSDIAKARELFPRLEHQTFESDVLGEMNAAVAFLTAMIPQDSTFADRLIMAGKDSVPGLQKLFDELDSSQADDRHTLQYYVADQVYELGRYNECKQMLQRILKDEPDNYLALSLLAPVNRNLGNFDEAIADCDKALEINHEDVAAWAQKARIELKRKQDAKASEYASKAYAIDNKNLYAMESIAMVAYFTGKKDECDKMVARIKAEETDSVQVIYTRLQKIINGTESYR